MDILWASRETHKGMGVRQPSANRCVFTDKRNDPNEKLRKDFFRAPRRLVKIDGRVELKKAENVRLSGIYRFGSKDERVNVARRYVVDARRHPSDFKISYQP